MTGWGPGLTLFVCMQELAGDQEPGVAQDRGAARKVKKVLWISA